MKEMQKDMLLKISQTMSDQLVTNCNRLKKANSLLAKLCRLGKTVS